MTIQESKKFTWITPIPPPFTPAKLIPTTYGHYYTNPQGVRYPSVTTMFSKLMPFEESPGYDYWLKKIKNEDRVDMSGAKAISMYISRVSRENGSTVHDTIEHYLNNKNTDIQLPLLVQAHLENLKPLLYNINNISYTEIPLYSDVMKLAGTADCVAEYNGVPSIIDFKTSNKKKDESYITNYFLQATAYAKMWEELTKQTIPQIVILISCNDCSLQEFVRKTTDYDSLLFEKLKKFEEIISWKSKNVSDVAKEEKNQIRFPEYVSFVLGEQDNDFISVYHMRWCNSSWW